MGCSRKLVQMFGIYAFSGDFAVDVHHIKSILLHPELKYDVKNLKVIPKPSHKILESAPELFDVEKNREYFHKIVAVLEELLYDEDDATGGMVMTGSFDSQTGKKKTGSDKDIMKFGLSDVKLNDLDCIADLLYAEAWKEAARLYTSGFKTGTIVIPVRLMAVMDKNGRKGIPSALFQYTANDNNVSLQMVPLKMSKKKFKDFWVRYQTFMRGVTQ